MQEFLPVELAHAWGSVTCQTIFRARWSTYFDSYNWKICLGAKYWKNCSWCSWRLGFHAEDLVDKYLPLIRNVSSLQRVVLTAIQVLRTSLKPLMLIVRLLQRISLLPTILFGPRLHCMIQIISNLPKIMTQWTQ